MTDLGRVARSSSNRLAHYPIPPEREGTLWIISRTELADGLVWSRLPDQNSFDSFLWSLLKAQVYPVEISY